MNLADALVPKSYGKGERIIKQGDLEHIQFPLLQIARHTHKKREIKLFLLLVVLSHFLLAMWCR